MRNYCFNAKRWQLREFVQLQHGLAAGCFPFPIQIAKSPCLELFLASQTGDGLELSRFPTSQIRPFLARKLERQPIMDSPPHGSMCLQVQRTKAPAAKHYTSDIIDTGLVRSELWLQSTSKPQLPRQQLAS